MTRMVGLFAYAVALMACALGWWLRRRRGQWGNKTGAGKLLGWLTLAHLVLLLDIAFDWRWKLHALFDQQASAAGVYGLRRWPQLTVLGILGSLTVISLIWIARRMPARSGSRIALMGTILSVALRGAEVISYHYLDAVLYLRVGGVMLIALLWLGCCGVTCLGVWMDAQNRRD